MRRVTLDVPAHGEAYPAEAENIVVGDEIVRHRLSSRLIHWSVAVLFFVLVFTGMPIWTPVFGWMAALFGGLEVCRWLHPWVGVAFSVVSVLMVVRWAGEMRLEKNERGWINPMKVIQYMKFRGGDSDVGKYNGGQKVFFFVVTLLTLGLLLTGLVLWWPMRFSRGLHELSLVLHDLAFIAFGVSIVFHIYLGSFAEPGTFQAMTRGTVRRSWARAHHPRWYREVTGEQRRR